LRSSASAFIRSRFCERLSQRVSALSQYRQN